MVKRKVRKKVKNVVRRGLPSARLNAWKFGLAGGILGAICILASSILMWFGYDAAIWFALITDIYGQFGYNAATFGGTVLGMIYGFIDSFILTGLFAWIYNKLL